MNSFESIRAQQLTTYIWNAVDLMRGWLDPTEAIECVIALLFLRLVSDEATLNIMLEAQEPKDVNSLTGLPRDFWMSIRNSSNPIYEIEQAISQLNYHSHQTFGDFFSTVDFEALHKRPDICHQLIDLVSRLNLGDLDQVGLGEIADGVLASLSKSMGMQSGAYFTPSDLTELMAALLDPKPGCAIYDPACGTGGLLISAYRYATINNIKSMGTSILGKESNVHIRNIAQLNMLLHGLPVSAIKIGNSLVDPVTSSTKRFDFIIMNPPIGLRHNESTLSNLDLAYFYYGPPTKVADYNFIQHALSLLSHDGRAVILSSLRPLFASGAEAQIRKHLIESDVIESIISLPANILPNTAAQPAILVFNKNKPESRKNKIIFIYADNESESGKLRRILGQQSKQKIVDLFHNFQQQEKFSAIVSLESVAAKGYMLLPANYVGLDELDVVLGSDVNWIEIERFANVFQGTKLGQRSEGNTPVIQGRDLTVAGLMADDLSKKDIPTELPKAIYTQAGDLLIQRIGQTPQSILVSESLSGVLVADTVFVIRPHEKIDLRNRYLVEFLNSSVGQAKLFTKSFGSVIPTLKLSSLRQLKIPVPNQSIMELINDLYDVEITLVDRVNKARFLRKQLFSIESPEKFDEQLQSLSVEAQVLRQSITRSEDTNFQIRNYYPYVLAYPYRSLDAITGETELYKEQLRVAENMLAFLGSVGLALVITTGKIREGNPKNFTIQMLREYWQNGISPGHWQDMASRAGILLRSQEEYAATKNFSNIWFKGKGTKQLQFAENIKHFVTRKNDFKHDRGPQAVYEYRDEIHHFAGELEQCLKEIAFFIQHPIRLVQESDIDWKTGKAVLNTLAYVGDHPGLRQEKIITSKPLSKDKLYLEMKEDLFVPLYPLVSVHYCTSCKTKETYIIDKWNPSDGFTVLKSFERGHTHSNDDISKVVSADIAHWLQDVFSFSEPFSAT